MISPSYSQDKKTTEERFLFGRFFILSLYVFIGVPTPLHYCNTLSWLSGEIRTTPSPCFRNAI